MKAMGWFYEMFGFMQRPTIIHFSAMRENLTFPVLISGNPKIVGGSGFGSGRGGGGIVLPQCERFVQPAKFEL